MYMQNSNQYRYHVETYGHPSKFGYKDTIPLWKAEKFDPEYLIGLYKKAGAKYFMSMGVHHDNFDLWDSKYNRWNSLNMGPKKDIVGMWKKAATDAGLKFAISDHLWISYKWLRVSHGSDSSGPLKGVPYDGADRTLEDLYHDLPTPDADLYASSTSVPWDDTDTTEAWKAHWFLRMKDLVDKYDPDYLYCDGPLPFENWGKALLAHLYNKNAMRNGGITQAVYTSKPPTGQTTGGMNVQDYERGIPPTILPDPWQTDTCIGNWHYQRGVAYKTPKTVVDMLADIVSRNGNLMLNFPLPASGMLDYAEMVTLNGITDWMGVNSEAIYATRPWKIYGASSAAPSTQASGRGGRRGGGAAFNETNRQALTSNDVRFTTKGSVLYAIMMGWPNKPQALIPSLALGGPQSVGKIQNVELLGVGKVPFTQDEKTLSIQLPEKAPSDYAVAFKIEGS
jgi:alpha-L-fucosidase